MLSFPSSIPTELSILQSINLSLPRFWRSCDMCGKSSQNSRHASQIENWNTLIKTIFSVLKLFSFICVKSKSSVHIDSSGWMYIFSGGGDKNEYEISYYHESWIFLLQIHHLYVWKKWNVLHNETRRWIIASKYKRSEKHLFDLVLGFQRPTEKKISNKYQNNPIWI